MSVVETLSGLLCDSLLLEFFSKISLIAGGALGNLYDRIVYNAVPDFIDLHYSGFHWFVFNVSDIVITFGIILLLLNDLFSKKNAQ